MANNGADSQSIRHSSASPGPDLFGLGVNLRFLRAAVRILPLHGELAVADLGHLLSGAGGAGCAQTKALEINMAFFLGILSRIVHIRSVWLYRKETATKI